MVLSSWVAFGHVGLSAAAPALQALGHEVTQLPMTLLSNHVGWPHVAGGPMPCDRIEAMIAALAANGWLAGHDAVLTGYMPTPEHAVLAAGLIRRLCALRPAPLVVVDPVLGDRPKGLYLPRPAAEAVRDHLVPLADILTPNVFELGWLTGQATDTPQQARSAAEALLDRGPAQDVLVTSCPAPPGQTGLLSVSHHAPRVWTTALHAGVPQGVGDVFAALIAAGLPAGAALGHLLGLIEASLGAPHLRIAESARHWTRAAALPSQPFPQP